MTSDDITHLNMAQADAGPLLQIMTRGRSASETGFDAFAPNRHQDYLFLHDLSVQMTEAFTEYLHKRILGELGFAAEDRATPNRC
jgi:cobalamin-dependent methionine synthase I